MRQLFQVGEEVILVSKAYPYANGEYIITEVITSLEMINKYGLMTGMTSSDMFYGLDGAYINLVKEGTNELTGLVCNHVHQSSLRKKHKPSEDNYSSLMDKLKIGETV